MIKCSLIHIKHENYTNIDHIHKYKPLWFDNKLINLIWGSNTEVLITSLQ